MNASSVNVLLISFMLLDYLKTSQFKRFIPDWITVLLLFLIFFFIVDPAYPFARKFIIDDSRLQHEFTSHERITDKQLYFLAGLLPLGLILLSRDDIHTKQINILGLCVSLSVNGVFTDILKNLIAGHRPDFIARCHPMGNVPSSRLVGIEVCTAPLGKKMLMDGMKSTPSGHSSISFSGLLYLYLWIIDYFKISRTSPLYHHIAAFVSVLLAIYICLSRTQDYRHHFFDIILGSAIGAFIASISYIRYSYSRMVTGSYNSFKVTDENIV